MTLWNRVLTIHKLVFFIEKNAKKKIYLLDVSYFKMLICYLSLNKANYLEILTSQSNE